jgi:hypothetical protein
LIAQTHRLVEDLCTSVANIQVAGARIEEEMQALAYERQALITWP